MEDVDSIYIELVGIDNTVDILERGEFNEEALEEVIEFLVKTACSSLKLLRRAQYICQNRLETTIPPSLTRCEKV